MQHTDLEAEQGPKEIHPNPTNKDQRLARQQRSSAALNLLQVHLPPLRQIVVGEVLRRTQALQNDHPNNQESVRECFVGGVGSPRGKRR